MKKSLVVAGLLLVTTGAFAADKDWSIGFEIGNSKMGGDMTGSNGASLSTDTDGGHQAIKIGKYFGNNIRVGLGLFNYNEEAGVDVSTQSIGVDYLIGDSNFKPFIGMSLSKFSYKESGFGANFNKDSIELKDTAFGIQFGGLYAINNNWDFEAGYRIIKSNGSDNITYTPTNTQLNIESNDGKAWYIGVNYNF